MEVEVTSRETIKPSSPTPTHLRRLKLSLLDQMITRNFIPFIYFYSTDSQPNDSHIKILKLKQSLIETITKFYPVAGRLKENLYIDCNDEGALYSEAQAKNLLAEILGNPNRYHHELNKLLPFPDIHDAGDLLLAIQVNIFCCGGMAIGICLSHKLGDALSTLRFFNCWAAFSRGDHNNIFNPQFDTSMIFPPRTDDQSLIARGAEIPKDKMVAKTFVFDASALSALKAKYAATQSSLSGVIQPTRVEVVSTIIWSRFIASVEDGEGLIEKDYTVTQAVNLRVKGNPPIPSTYIGNLSWFATIIPSVNKKTEKNGYGLVSLMRKAVKEVNIDYVKQVQETKISKENAVPCSRDVVIFGFSSVLNGPQYEADFGWGRPQWVTLPTMPFQNLVSILPSKSGVGVEALINLKEADMAKLEVDKEFLSFASPYTGHPCISRM